MNLMLNEVLWSHRALGARRCDGRNPQFTYSQPIIRQINEAIYPSVVAYLADVTRSTGTL